MKLSRNQCFIARLKSLQDRRGMRVTDYAAFLGLREKRICDFLEGKRLPMASELWRIAAKEHVSMDWLLGLSTSMHPALTAAQQEFLVQKRKKCSQLKEECEEMVAQCLAQGKRLSDDPQLLDKNTELDDIMLWCDIVNSLSASAACKH